jgi:hypothetical protein
MGPSRLSKTIQGITVAGLASVGAFFVWTKHCHMTPLNQFTPTTEPLFQSSWYKKYNPLQNPTTHDECVRRLPLFKIRPELVEDAQKGGSKLVEAFSQGIWGGPGTFVHFPWSTAASVSSCECRDRISRAVHRCWTLIMKDTSIT